MPNSAITQQVQGLATTTSPGLVGTGAQTFAGKKTLDGGALIKGDTSGVAIATGYVGERVWVNIPSTNGSTTRGVETNVATLSIPSAGIWSLHAVYQRSIILSNNTTGYGCLFDVTIYNGANLLAESREIVPNGTNQALVERTMSVPYYVTTGAASLDLKIRADRWSGTEGFTITSQNIGLNNGSLTGFWALRVA